jgi:hypothetical protein
VHQPELRRFFEPKGPHKFRSTGIFAELNCRKYVAVLDIAGCHGVIVRRQADTRWRNRVPTWARLLLLRSAIMSRQLRAHPVYGREQWICRELQSGKQQWEVIQELDQIRTPANCGHVDSTTVRTYACINCLVTGAVWGVDSDHAARSVLGIHQEAGNQQVLLVPSPHSWPVSVSIAGGLGRTQLGF